MDMITESIDTNFLALKDNNNKKNRKQKRNTEFLSSVNDDDEPSLLDGHFILL